MQLPVDPARSPVLRTGDASGRVTTFELFFDLVYVFAFTQVSHLMAETHTALGILQALVVLGLLWWTWCSYSWLGNQAPADQAVVQSGMSVAMIAMFVVALTIPEAYEDLPGGWSGPLVFVLAYTLVRFIHAGLYVIAAGSDRALRAQVLRTQALATAPAVVALTWGAIVGTPAQTWIWLGAFAWDFVVTYTSARGGGGWHLYAPAHWAERYGLIVILALGESIVAIGVGVAEEAIDGAIALGTVLAVSLSILLWRAYFARLSAAGEHALERRRDAARVVFARDAYTYLHFFIVAGVIHAALGVEQAMAHIGEGEAFGVFGASALGGGLAVYLGGTAVFGRSAGLPWPIGRLAATLTLVAAIPLLGALTPLWALVLAMALVAMTVAAEAMARVKTPTASPSF